MNLPLCQIFPVFSSAMRTPEDAPVSAGDKRPFRLIITWLEMRIVYSVSTLFWPKPSECAGGQQAINQAVQHVLEGDAPIFALPDCILNESERVCRKRKSSGHSEDFQILRSGRSRPTGEIRGEETDYNAINKPLRKKFPHRWHAAWPQGEQAHRASFELLVRFGRFHLLVSAKREDVTPARRYAS